LYKSRIIKSEAVRIVERTEEGAPALPEGAITSADRVQNTIRDAYEKGMAEGVRKERDLHARESSRALKVAEEAIRQTARLNAAIIERSEGEILGLIFAIAEKVIHHEVTVNKAVVRNVLKSAVEAINDRETISVRCHPGDMAALQELRPELLATIDGLSNVALVEDAAISPGGVKIEAGIGEVDARIERQFEVIKNAVLS